MAIKISGTTVIDNSRNICNIGTINATGLNGSVGGEYICQIACSDITEGDMVMFEGSCAATVKVDDPSYYTRCQPACANQCGGLWMIPLKFCCSETCFASVIFTASDNFLCTSFSDAHYICLNAHCVATDGVYTTEVVATCSCCHACQQYYDRDAGQHKPISMSSCEGTKAYIFWPYVQITGCSVYRWLAACYCTATEQISLICICETCRYASTCHYWTEQARTPKDDFFVTMAGTNCVGGSCRLCDNCVRINVKKINNSIDFSTAYNISGANIRCGVQPQCYYVCCQFQYNCTNSNSLCNPFCTCFTMCCNGCTIEVGDSCAGWGGIIPEYAYGCDGWIISGASWGEFPLEGPNSTCYCYCFGGCRTRYGWYFAFRPVSDNCVEFSCNRIMPSCEGGHYCCCPRAGIPFRNMGSGSGQGCYYNGSNLQPFTQSYQLESGQVMPFYDPGDGIKRLPFSQFGCSCNTWCWSIACFCVGSYCLIYMNDETKGCTGYSTTLGHPNNCYLHATNGCACQVGNYGVANHSLTNVCLGYTGGEPTSCFVEVIKGNGDNIHRPNKARYNASWPICAECGMYLFAGQPENVLGQHASCNSNCGMTKDINVARCCMFDSPASSQRTAAFCYQLQAPVCMQCVFCYPTCTECVRCLHHVVVPCDCDSIRVSGEPYCCGRAHAKLGGVIPMQNGEVIIAAGNGYYNGIMSGAYTQDVCLISYTKGVTENNHRKWLGIAQNTVSAGNTVRIAVPGMTDRSSFTQNCIIDGFMIGQCSWPSHCHNTVQQLRMCSRTGLACQLFGTITGAVSACCFCLYSNEYINFHPMYDCNKGGYINYFAQVGCY